MVRFHWMMPHAALPLLLAALSGCSTGQPSSVAHVPPPAAASAAQPVDFKVIDGLLDKAREAWGVPGVAVAIVRGDEVLYLKGSGFRDLNTREPVTPDT